MGNLTDYALQWSLRDVHLLRASPAFKDVKPPTARVYSEFFRRCDALYHPSYSCTTAHTCTCSVALLPLDVDSLSRPRARCILWRLFLPLRVSYRYHTHKLTHTATHARTHTRADARCVLADASLV
jgi:hypothetical protein